MKKNKIVNLLFLICSLFIVFTNTKVNAASVLETAIAPGKNPSLPDAGKIILHDDYTITFDYEYRVKDIKIWICADSQCLNGDAQIEPNQTYMGNTSVEFDLNQYLIKKDTTVEYKVKAVGDFKYQESDATGSLATLIYQIEIKGNVKDVYGKDEDVFDNSQDALSVVNHWIIPGIYVVLAIVFVIKSILLCMDLIRYSDHPDVRKEKIRGFIYIFVGLLVVFLINSTVGVITGLFS